MPSEKWSASIRDGVTYIDVVRLEPGSHLAFNTDVPFRTGYLDHAKFDWRIDVLCFDPINNKSIIYKVLSKFSIERVLHGLEGQTRIGTK
jgi:hypothetical protein